MDIPTLRTHTSFDRSPAHALILSLLGASTIVGAVAAALASPAALAAVFMVAGAIDVIFAWGAGSRDGVVWRVIVGIVYFAAGYVVAGHPSWSVPAVSIVVSATLLVEATLTLMAYFASEGASPWILLSGMATAVVATLTAGHFSLSLRVIVGAVGANLFVGGFASLASWMESERLKELR